MELNSKRGRPIANTEKRQRKHRSYDECAEQRLNNNKKNGESEKKKQFKNPIVRGRREIQTSGCVNSQVCQVLRLENYIRFTDQRSLKHCIFSMSQHANSCNT